MQASLRLVATVPYTWSPPGACVDWHVLQTIGLAQARNNALNACCEAGADRHRNHHRSHRAARHGFSWAPPPGAGA